MSTSRDTPPVMFLYTDVISSEHVPATAFTKSEEKTMYFYKKQNYMAYATRLLCR